MYFVTLSKFWWKFAKKRGYLDGPVKFVKSKRLGLIWVIKETLKEWFS